MEKTNNVQKWNSNANRKLFYMAFGILCALYEGGKSVYGERICSIQPDML
jgi:hypothetical protein